MRLFGRLVLHHCDAYAWKQLKNGIHRTLLRHMTPHNSEGRVNPSICTQMGHLSCTCHPSNSIMLGVGMATLFTAWTRQYCQDS